MLLRGRWLVPFGSGGLPGVGGARREEWLRLAVGGLVPDVLGDVLPLRGILAVSNGLSDAVSFRGCYCHRRHVVLLRVDGPHTGRCHLGIWIPC